MGAFELGSGANLYGFCPAWVSDLQKHRRPSRTEAIPNANGFQVFPSAKRLSKRRYPFASRCVACHLHAITRVRCHLCQPRFDVLGPLDPAHPYTGARLLNISVRLLLPRRSSQASRRADMHLSSPENSTDRSSPMSRVDLPFFCCAWFQFMLFQPARIGRFGFLRDLRLDFGCQLCDHIAFLVRKRLHWLRDRQTLRGSRDLLW